MGNAKTNVNENFQLSARKPSPLSTRSFATINNGIGKRLRRHKLCRRGEGAEGCDGFIPLRCENIEYCEVAATGNLLHY